MKIYFAGSIRGGRDDTEKYFALINHLKQYGQVLSEHIGLATLDSSGEKKSSEEVYQRDVEWIREADVVVVEVSTPSLGVGYELRLAEELNKKILCLFEEKEGKLLSFMVSGNKNIKVKHYKTLKEATDSIDEFLKQ